MTWSAFFIDETGETYSESCADWQSAQETLHGLIDMARPKNTDVTLHRELGMARSESDFHVTDGAYQFAIEEVASTKHI